MFGLLDNLEAVGLEDRHGVIAELADLKGSFDLNPGIGLEVGGSFPVDRDADG
jgi:hypothetical protein